MFHDTVVAWMPAPPFVLVCSTSTGMQLHYWPVSTHGPEGRVLLCSLLLSQD